MSNITVFHTNNAVYFGSDSAVSVEIDNCRYRLSDDGKKIFIIDNMLIFCSGTMAISYSIINEFNNSIIKNVDILQAIAKNKYIDDSSFLEILVGVIENNSVVVYQISSYDNFNIIRKTVNDNELGIWTGGLKTQESFDIAVSLFSNNKQIQNIYQEIFDSISCEEIGGILSIYKMDIDKNINLIYDNLINEPHDLKRINRTMIVGERLIGRVIAGENLTITSADGAFNVYEDETGQIKVDIEGGSLNIKGGLPTSQLADGVLLENKLYNGVKIDITNGLTITRSDNKVRSISNATDGFSIEKWENSDWTKKLYADTDGNLILKGHMQIGSGSSIFKADNNGIYLGSSNYNYAPFRVDLLGNLTATSANIQGNIDCSSLKIAGTNVLDELNRFNGNYLSEKSVGASKLKVNELIVGDNIQMGANAYIAWNNVTSKPNIPSKASDVGALPTNWVGTTYIDANGVYTGTIVANQINTVGLASERIYKQNSPFNYAVIGGNWADLILYNQNGEYFRIVDGIDGTGAFRCSGRSFLSFSSTGAQPLGSWNFSNCNVTGLSGSATAVFG